MMQYTLLTKRGIVMQFYIESVALLYQSLYGGVVISQQSVLDNAAEPCYTVSID
jgi:hypothetical protein